MQRGFAFNIIYYMEPHEVGFEGSRQNETEKNQINISAATEIGPRNSNNDVAVVNPDCIGVIDGSGDGAGVSEAANTIQQIMVDGLRGREFASENECLIEVNNLLMEAQKACSEAQKGACVSFGVPFSEGGRRRLLIVNAGDARATFIGGDGKVFQTLDNNQGVRQKVVNEKGKLILSATEADPRTAYNAQATMDKYAHGEGPKGMFGRKLNPDPETALRLQNRNKVIGEIGSADGAPAIETYLFDINEGDTVVFTTDGATQRISTATMKEVLKNNGGAAEMLAHKNVKALPAHDNSTVVVARF